MSNIINEKPRKGSQLVLPGLPAVEPAVGIRDKTQCLFLFKFWLWKFNNQSIGGSCAEERICFLYFFWRARCCSLVERRRRGLKSDNCKKNKQDDRKRLISDVSGTWMKLRHFLQKKNLLQLKAYSYHTVTNFSKVLASVTWILKQQRVRRLSLIGHRRPRTCKLNQIRIQPSVPKQRKIKYIFYLVFTNVHLFSVRWLATIIPSSCKKYFTRNVQFTNHISQITLTPS